MSLIPSRSIRISSINAWNSQIREAVNQNDPLKSLILYRDMKRQGIEPNNFTFPFVTKACAKLSDLHLCEIIHGHIVKSPFWSDVFVGTTMVDMYSKCNHLEYAVKVFDKMPKRDTAAWNVMLCGFSQLGQTEKTFSFFREMRFNEINPDSVTIMTLIQSSSNEESLKLLRTLHSFGIRLGVNAQVTVANTWISAYAKCGDLDSAKSVFESINSNDRTVVSWNSMIGACTNFDAFSYYRLMLCEEFKPDLTTLINLSTSCLNPKDLTKGKLIHSHSIHLGSDQAIALVNTLISMYSKSGDICSARLLFDGLSSRTCVSWTVMINGYAEKGDINEALALFRSMNETGEKPDLVTILSLISGCGKTGSLDIGRWVDTYADTNGFKRESITVSNALIDMYSKCGSIPEARDIFNGMTNKTVVTWTSMIAGYALNGIFVEALKLFNEMISSNCKPNHITFLAVLQACCHSGALEKGWEYFHMMKEVYNIDHGVDHHSCMVYLLGRKGKLKEAKDLIHNMLVKPDVGIWGALLNACKIHGNVEIGEYAFNHLFALEPQTAASYVEMANIYASAGKWDGVARIRSLMKCKNVKKYPGESVIRVNGKNHVFTVEDRDHPQGEAIYAFLDSLSFFAKDETFAV